MEVFTGKHHGSFDRKIIYTWGIFLQTTFDYGMVIKKHEIHEISSRI